MSGPHPRTTLVAALVTLGVWLGGSCTPASVVAPVTPAPFDACCGVCTDERCENCSDMPHRRCGGLGQTPATCTMLDDVVTCRPADE